MTMFRPLSRFGIAGACTGILLAGCYNLCGDEHRGDGLRSAFSVVHASSHSGPGKVKATKFSDYSHEIPVDNAIERDWLSIIDQGKWDNNWDKRDPEYLRQGRKKEEGDIQRPTASRRIILIRHGQYNLSGKGDAEKYLTELGHRQAAATATRLQELLGDSPPDLLIHSTMTRARETFTAFQKVFSDVEVKSSDLLREGAPYPPDPPSKNYRPDHHQFSTDGARIEAGFRKYFHRADVDQTTDSVEVIVCHANVIRYYVCRALQLPPSAWLRISLPHCSLTVLDIRPNGRVSLRTMGESGHLPPSMVTLQ